MKPEIIKNQNLSFFPITKYEQKTKFLSKKFHFCGLDFGIIFTKFPHKNYNI